MITRRVVVGAVVACPAVVTSIAIGGASANEPAAARIAALEKRHGGDALTAPSREQLIGWPVANKTGTGSNGATNDIAVAWPPGREPILITAYYAESTASPEQRNAVHADIARTVAPQS